MVHLRRGDVTAVEVALDLEVPSLSALPAFLFSGAVEPRVCLVAAFALTSQLKRIVAAIDRVLPARLPATIRIAPVKMRSPTASAPGAASIQPMRALIRIQSRIIRAIEPGLASPGDSPTLDEPASHYVREFIPSNALPALEPSRLPPDLASSELKPLGITVYRLDHTGKPQSILAHWAYATNRRGNVPLRGGP